MQSWDGRYRTHRSKYNLDLDQEHHCHLATFSESQRVKNSSIFFYAEIVCFRYVTGKLFKYIALSAYNSCADIVSILKKLVSKKSFYKLLFPGVVV